MFHVIHGTDTVTVSERTRGVVEQLVRETGATVHTFDDILECRVDVEAIVGARGLFADQLVIVLKTSFEAGERSSAELREFVLDHLELFARSGNHVVLSISGKVLVEQARSLKQHAHTVDVYDREVDKKQSFNVFTLTDALQARDRKRLWLVYGEAIRSGIEPENVSGTLHFSVKQMLNVATASTAEATGLTPFQYAKAKRGACLFTVAELVALSRTLVQVYHDAHRGRCDLALALERWVLSV